MGGRHFLYKYLVTATLGIFILPVESNEFNCKLTYSLSLSHVVYMQTN